MRRKFDKVLKKIISAAMAIVILSTSPSFAGQWVQDGSNWKYQNINGSYATNWQWIDGRAYCFDQNGNMYVSTTTPDGYTVDSSGAWTINGVVQVKESESQTTSDDESPLKGRLDSWFVIEQAQNPAVWSGYVDTSVRIKWLWSDTYLLNHPEVTNGMVADDYALKIAIENRNPRYMSVPADYLALAELTGLERIGNDEYYALEGDKIDAVKREAINFLNSFPNWKTASDFEKATRICNWIQQAEYDETDDDSYYSYGCLVNKKASCQGYTNAATLLAWCVDLPISRLGTISHTYPVFYVNEVWLSNEPTTKSKFLISANVYDKNDLGTYQRLGKYCEGVGYDVPKEESQLSYIGGTVETVFESPAIRFN